MTESEKASIQKRLDTLTRQFDELLGRQPGRESANRRISSYICQAHDLFEKAVRTYIDECVAATEAVDSSLIPYEVFDEYVDTLSEQCYWLRVRFVSVFPTYFASRSHLYWLIRDLALTFPEGIALQAAEPFVVIATGRVATFPLGPVLVQIGHVLQASNDEVQERLNEVRTNQLRVFQCDAEAPITHQAILDHELFHVVLEAQTNIISALELLTQEQATLDLLQCDNPMAMQHVRELFCDFGAAWHAGPVYARAFVHELSLGTRHAGERHPRRLLRAHVIRHAFPRGWEHPAIGILHEFCADRQREAPHVTSAGTRQLAGQLRRLLKDELRIRRYPGGDVSRRELVAQYRRHNVPYIYADICDLLNGIPGPADLQDARERSDLTDFILESIRKTHVWDEVAKQMEKQGPFGKPLLPTAFIAG